MLYVQDVHLHWTYNWLGAEITTGQRLTVTGEGAGERQDEYPLGRDVLTFPEE